VSSRLPLPILRALPDGSYRSLLINPKIRGRRREMLLAAAAAGEHLEPTQVTLIRVIEYLIEDRPGNGALFCLITHDHRPTARTCTRPRHCLPSTLGNRTVL
jgi:hypothetical protein